MFGLNYAYSMPRTEEKKTGRRVPENGAKRGPKVKHNNAINDLVVIHYGGDRQGAANAWGCSKDTVDRAIAYGVISEKLAFKIAEALKDHVTLDQLAPLTKKKTH
jgi:hypothetical protein